uniref:Alpha-1,4-N-acetylglucosaminyltransferase n=2 Tax=Clastoptera arizonana TaxID=38151 RepID=A0A1B6EA26_9HEMI
MKPNTSYYHKLPRKVCKKIYFLFAIFILGWIIIIFTINQSKVGVSRSFSMKEAMVPNIVHFIIFNKNTINFVTFLCISAALKIQKPDQVILHCDNTEFSGHYWSLLVSLGKKTKIRIKISHFIRPTHVYGQPLSSIYHSADVARILVLMKYGGIYLDTDTLLLKPLNQFLKYEMVIGLPPDDYMGCQILIGRKDARFLNLWLQGYKRYKPSMWYYNAGQYPTEQILVHNPDIFHRVPLLFGVHNLADKLYMQVEWPEWKTYFSLHLLSRHPPAPSFINETTILNDSTVFSEIATWSLFHLGPKLDVLHNEWVDIS